MTTSEELQEEIILFIQNKKQELESEVDEFTMPFIKTIAEPETDEDAEYAQKELQEALEFTKENTGLNLVMALSYSGRWELLNAVKNIAYEVDKGNLTVEEISQNTLQKYLCTSNFPDPELMIRTSGEYRISNFLLYQLAYAELYFTDVRWPEFRKKNLYEAIINFQSRERRFGKTSEQVTNKVEDIR